MRGGGGIFIGQWGLRAGDFRGDVLVFVGESGASSDVWIKHMPAPFFGDTFSGETLCCPTISCPG